MWTVNMAWAAGSSRYIGHTIYIHNEEACRTSRQRSALNNTWMCRSINRIGLIICSLFVWKLQVQIVLSEFGHMTTCMCWDCYVVVWPCCFFIGQGIPQLVGNKYIRGKPENGRSPFLSLYSVYTYVEIFWRVRSVFITDVTDIVIVSWNLWFVRRPAYCCWRIKQKLN